MRLALAGFNLESVTFLPDPTSLDNFEALAKRGRDLIDSFNGTNTVPGGFIAECRSNSIDIMPLVYSEVGAAAAATDDAYDCFLTEIADGILKAKNDIDGLLLGLHGALVTTSGKTDLNFLQELRNRIGNQIPIGVSFDLHGNLDPKIVELADVISAYHESPHVDMGETGQRVAQLLIAKIKGEITPCTLLKKIPITLPSIFTATQVNPLKKVMLEARKKEQETTNLLDCSIVMGFAYSDVPQIGMSIIATANHDIEIAERAATEMAFLIWNMRKSLYPKESIFSVSAGLLKAQSIAKLSLKPVVILEHADRMNDSTYVLEKLLSIPKIKAAVPYFYDPESANLAVKAGVGATVYLSIGAKSSNKAGKPILASADVIWTGKPSFLMGGVMGKGRPVNLGQTAIIKIKEIFIWLISANTSAINLDPFEQFGFCHEDFDIVLLRSKTHFRAVWEKESAGIIIVDTPDWGPGLLSTLPYRNARPGVFPIT